MVTMRWRTSKTIQARATLFREQPTPAEALLWKALRGRQLGGFKFRRQHALGRYIADFCCVEQHLIIELDGPIHMTQRDQDDERTRQLEQLGYTVLRYPNERIEHDLDAVLAELRAMLKENQS
jgi:very-short-patch-repair endonuclease